MKPQDRMFLIPALTAAGLLAAGVAAFALWRARDATGSLGLRLPGMDGRPAGMEGLSAEKVAIGEIFEEFGKESPRPGPLPGSWPRFRGPDFDNISKEAVPLADRWPAGGPKVLWSVDLGEGYAGAAVHRGRVYVLDYDEKKKADALRCLSLEDGREIWRRSYRVKVQRNHGMSRTVPAVDDRVVVTIGPRCHVMAADPASGALKWTLDLEKDYGTATPLWYTGQCPLLDGPAAVIAPGGKKALMIGVDAETGKVAWETPNPKGWAMSHSSVMPMTLNGQKMYVYCSQGGVVGVSAAKGDAGRLLWELPEWSGQVIAPSPLVLDDGLVYVTAGYNAGSLLFRVSEKDGRFEAKVVRRLTTQAGLASEQQTPIYYDKHLFAVFPKDAGGLRQQFACVRPDDHGKVVWSSGKEKRFGLGPFLLADGKFFLLNDDGVLTVIRAGTGKYEELSEVKVLQGQDSWGPIALAGGRMILRDSKRMICIDVRKQ
jgi:outer membrane protein assembly factor BamB